MNIIKLIVIFSTVSLIFNHLVVLNTESFILFLAFFILVIIMISINKSIINYNKELFKFNETIYFYNIMKLWYRIKFRENDIKSLLFANLVIDIINYKILFIERLFISGSLKKNEYNNLVVATRNRLEKFKNYKNNLKTSSSGLNSLPINSTVK